MTGRAARRPPSLGRNDRLLRGGGRPLARHARRLRLPRLLPLGLRLRVPRARPGGSGGEAGRRRLRRRVAAGRGRRLGRAFSSATPSCSAPITARPASGRRRLLEQRLRRPARCCAETASTAPTSRSPPRTAPARSTGCRSAGSRAGAGRAAGRARGRRRRAVPRGRRRRGEARTRGAPLPSAAATGWQTEGEPGGARPSRRARPRLGGAAEPERRRRARLGSRGLRVRRPRRAPPCRRRQPRVALGRRLRGADARRSGSTLLPSSITERCAGRARALRRRAAVPAPLSRAA